MTKRSPTPVATAPAPEAAPVVEPAGEPIAAEQPTTEPVSDVSSDDVAAQVDAGDRVAARVLIAFEGYEPNDVVELAEDELVAHRDLVDPTPAAVAYARSLLA